MLQPEIAPKPARDEYEGVTRPQLMRMLATSFLPLAILILSVLGAILLGLATPSEAAAIGALGGLILAASYQLSGFFAGTDRPPTWTAWQLEGERWSVMPCLAFGAFASTATLVLVTYIGLYFGYSQTITGWPAGLWAGLAAVYGLAAWLASPMLMRLLGAVGSTSMPRRILARATWIAALLAIAATLLGAIVDSLAGEGETGGGLREVLRFVARYATFAFGLGAIVLLLSAGLHWALRNVAPGGGMRRQFLKLTGAGALVGLALAVAFVVVGTYLLDRNPSWRLIDVFVLAFPFVVACMLGTKWDGLRESVYLAVRTSAMVCWLFVGSWTFSSVFSYLGGEQLISEFVTSLDLTPLMFLILAQFIIFLLGWPLEWSEIVIIFVPIFLPLLPHFGIDPLFFGILVALNLQTSFLTPPMAMSAYYLKGIAPPHVRLVQIFSGCMPFLMMVFLAMIIVYVIPGIVYWLPNLAYG